MAFLGSQLNTGVLSEICPLRLGQSSSQYCATSGVISVLLSDPAHNAAKLLAKELRCISTQTSDTLSVPFFRLPGSTNSGFLSTSELQFLPVYLSETFVPFVPVPSAVSEKSLQAESKAIIGVTCCFS